VDGNKRLAWSAARIFCLLNGRDLTCTVDEAEDVMLSAASGQIDVPQIAAWAPGPHSECVLTPRNAR
jgi:death-on-curing protein